MVLFSAMLVPALSQARTLWSAESPEQLGATNTWAPLGWTATRWSDTNIVQSWTAFPSAQQACQAISLGYCALDEYGNSDQCINLNARCGNAAEISTPGYAVQVCVLRRELLPRPSGAKNTLYHTDSNRCFCPRGTIIDHNTASCMPVTEDLRIALTGGEEVRPLGTGGMASVTLIARVTDATTPKAGVLVDFSVGVTGNSGGHEHDDPSRPRGSLSVVGGATDANGEIKVTFSAPEVAGVHTVKAACGRCTNNAVTKEVKVKVPDLLPVSPNAPQNADSTFVYALTSVDKTHQGNGRYHHNQYYLTQQSQINLQSMIDAFAAEGWGTVALNDASLYWGGRYDIYANWGQPAAAKEPHAGHREGREIDVSFARAGNPISAPKQKVFYDKFCKNKKVSFPFSILHHYVKNPHFHVYLEKQTACWKSEK